MNSSGEIIITFGLSHELAALVDTLVSSFTIDVIPLTIGTVRNFVKNNQDKKISLVIYSIDTTHPRQARVIQLIRDFVGPLAPFLVLVPRENLAEIKKYLDAGADDFIELPLNENRFFISFLILLEMGQAIGQASPRLLSAEPVVPKHHRQVEQGGWQRVVHYFQEGLNFFTPKSLLGATRTENISDRWQPLRQLGGGGFGTVWLVQEIGGSRLAVAKTPHSPAMNIGVLRSAAILKRLVHHPNVVQLIEVVKDSGCFVLIQEYVQGPTLQELLKERMAGLDKENIFLQLLSVVAYAHTHKILHRDIKPENIMVTETGRIKLLDFGIARDLTWQGADNSTAGTINFMPPEQFAGKSCLASDVWAIGVILYIFATNAVPYFQLNNDYPQDVETSLEIPLPRTINPQLDVELERIIMRCLEKNLEKRYASAIELANDVREYFPQFGRGELLPS